jgi:type III pantothenate kinase
MANLAVDIGNTSVKAAVFDGGRIVERLTGEEWKVTGGEWDGAIVASTRSGATEIEEEIRRKARFFIRLDYATPIPIKNSYGTPRTLGADRLAAAVGAHTVLPGRTVLVVDFGTAITFDMVTAAGEYLGGNISPGAGARFRALNEFTGALPLLSLSGATGDFPAGNTKNAIENGVVAGIVAETEYYINLAREKFGATETIFTGGDAEYFAERVKFPIFASSDLVFQGLNAILEHNANL